MFAISPRPRARLCASTALAAALLLSPALRAETIETGSTVSAATVYPRGATVTRDAAFAAPAGRHSVVIDNLPIDIDADSLRVEGSSKDGEFSILGLNYRVDRPSPEPLSDPERERIAEAIRAVEYDIRTEEDAIEAAVSRRKYAEGVRKATLTSRPVRSRGEGGPTPVIDDVDAWKAAWDLLSDEVARAQRAEREAEVRLDAHRRALIKLERQLIATAPQPPRGVLTVSIRSAAQVADGLLSVRYLTRQASWSPLYDLRLRPIPAEEAGASGKATLEIVRRAAVRQSTGEDWTAAALTLSTARPTAKLEAVAPRITQARLRPPPSPSKVATGKRTSQQLQAQRFDKRSREEADDYAGAEPAAEAPAPIGGAVVHDLIGRAAPRAPKPAAQTSALASYQGAAAIYRIPDPVDVPGDGETRQARIGAFETKLDTEVRATPARDPSAYLYAIFPNADQPLPPGRAALYRGDAYLGQLMLPYVAPGETKPLAFGRFEAVKVERRIRDRSEGQEGVFTTSNRRQSRFEITVRNLGDEPVQVRISDSLPYTEDDRIKVTLNSAPKPTARDVDGRRGALEWSFPLPKKASKAIAFSYTLSWPEGEKLDLLAR